LFGLLLFSNYCYFFTKITVLELFSLKKESK